MTPQQVTDLLDFVALLEEKNELWRIAPEVDPHLEIAAITDRVCKGAAGRRALLFERVLGHELPVLTNLFGSHQRTAWAVGLEEADQLRHRLRDGLARHVDGLAADRFSRLLAEPNWQPQLVADGPCREVVMDPPDLRQLPALHCWPGDGGRFLTQSSVFTRDPDNGRGNCGMYRVQLFGRDQATLRWRPDSGGARHLAAWEQRDEPMPVAIVLGGDPAAVYAACAPLPDGVDEMALAGWLRRRPLDMVPCLTNDLAVPAAAEIVIEGLVEPGNRRLEGPFGNHRGGYDPAAPAALLRVSAITHRQTPLFPAIVTGPPPMESGYLAKLSERLLLALLQTDFPHIVDINMPMETIFHGVTLLAVRRERDGDVAELARSLWSRKPLKQAKLLLFVDERTDVQDARGCFWRAINRVDTQRDLLHDGPRLAIDATRLSAQSLAPDPVVMARLERRWAEFGFDI
ncbi:MAG: UbiD family decarboxylase [Syntrophotaleaceae bacterium]